MSMTKGESMREVDAKGECGCATQQERASDSFRVGRHLSRYGGPQLLKRGYCRKDATRDAHCTHDADVSLGLAPLTSNGCV